MTDIDFDELDRAVNSAVDGTKVDDNTGVAGVDMPVTPIPETTDQSVETPVAPPLAVRRSSGQFMDVVHPSSDMRRSTGSNPSRPVPIVPATPVYEPVQPSQPTPEPDQTPSVPDLQSNPIVGVNDLTSMTQNDDSDIDKINDDISAVMGQNSVEPSEPQESPFLPGTKVEKRPLGAFSDETVVPQTEEQPVETLAENEPTDEVKSSIEPIQPEIDELQSDNDLSQVETTNIPELNTTEAEPATEVKPSEAADNGPVSIVQQYKEQPSTGDQTTGAIYDTDTYHKALVKPDNKRSVWLWVALVLGLVVLGAGVGAAVYFFAIPHVL